MAQVVFEFASESLDSIIAAIEHVLGSANRCCEVAAQSLDYEPCPDFLTGISRLRDNGAASLVCRPDQSSIRYALVNKPLFNGAKLSAWSGTIESTDSDWTAVWNQLLETPVPIVCVGMEEGVPLDDMEHLNGDAFPWRASELIIAAVRDGSGHWQIQRGRSYYEPHRE